jgi:vancomycin resistance protein YoaR
MSEATQTVTVEEVKLEVVATEPAPTPVVPDIEKIIKDVLKSAIKELLEELKKPAVPASLDKDGDGVISATEVKEAVKEQAQKLGCGPSCTIS